MKRRALLGHLQEHGCVPLREGGSHSIWSNPQTGRKEAIPRHSEIKNTWPVPSAATCPCRFRPAIKSVEPSRGGRWSCCPPPTRPSDSCPAIPLPVSDEIQSWQDASNLQTPLHGTKPGFIPKRRHARLSWLARLRPGRSPPKS